MKTISLMLAAILTLAAGCSRSGTAAKPAAPPVPVLAAPALETNLPVQLHAIGNVTAVNKVTVRSQIGGRLQAVNFHEGQPVRAGDLLFSIDPRPAQAALDQARASLARDTAQLDNARVSFNREQKLFDQKIASPDEYDASKAALDALAGTVAADTAAVSNAVLNLEYCSIRSPVDGVTGSQQVFAGNIVKSPDDVMLMINQIRPIYVAFAVPEQYLSQIRAEMRARSLLVEAAAAGSPDAPARGEVTFMDNAVDTTTGTIQLKGTFANEDGALWPGQFVQVTLTLAEIPRAVIVPNQAIQTGQNGDYVYVVNSGQAAQLRLVKTGDRLDGETVVTEGLKAGELVVTDGQLRLVAGSRVDVKASLTNAPSQP
jgi:membrane fusion protein, multidrug efflux system